MNLIAVATVIATNMKRQSGQILDELLILRCQEGDRASVEMLVSRWQSPLVRFAGVVSRDPDIAREAVQDAWLAIIRGLPTLQDPGRYRGWMFRIVHNKCIDLIRSQKPRCEPVAAEESTRAQFDVLENRDEINAVLASLTDDHRVVLALHYLYEMELTEIADALGIPGGTVKSRLFNAREAFRQNLEQRGIHHEPERTGSTNRESPRIYRFT